MREQIVNTEIIQELELLRIQNEELRMRLNLEETKNRILIEENQLLRVFEEDYKAISDQTLVGIFISQDDKYVYVSDGFTSITEHSIATILNTPTKDILDLVHPEDKHIVSSTVEKRNVSQSNEVFNSQFRLRKKNGGYVWLETWSKRIKYRGRPASIITYVDVTDRLMYQYQIHESQALYSNLFANSPTGLIFAGRSGEILEANMKVVEMMGSPSIEATKQINLFTFQPIIDCGFANFLKRSILEGEHFSGKTFYISKWSKKLWVNYHFDPIKDSSGGVVGVLINFIDVTEQNNNEKALLESEEKLRKIFLSSPNAIAIVDRNGIIVNCNDRQVAIFGYNSKSEIIGLHASKIIPLATYNELKKRIVYTPTDIQRIPNYECQLTRRDGEEFYAEISGGMIIDDEHKPLNFIAVTQDISIRKANEKELIEAKNKAVESDRLKTAFLENMSHEIRTPLNGIIGFLEILTDEDVSPDEKAEFVDIIHNCSGQLLTIINDILEVSKITSGQLQVNNDWVDFRDLLNEISIYYNAGRIKQLKSNATLVLQYDLDGHHSMIFTDAERLRQVITNLINNALKFCSDGTVVLSCRFTEELGLVFSVKDDGIGIAAEMHDLIFERFRQVDGSMSRKYGGTGLGLAICRSLVEMLGGAIWVDSELGKGASFYFTLPYDADHVTEGIVNSQLEMPFLPNKKILVIDKSKLAFDFLRIALRKSQITFEFAECAEDALVLFESGQTYHLIFADTEILQLHDNLGFEHIESFCPRTPLVVFGLYEADCRKIAEERNSGWMTKPLNKGKIISAIQQFII